MIDLYRIFNERFSNCTYIKINKYLEKIIQNEVVKILDVRDIGELRDRYEGQNFLDNKVNRVFAFLVASDYLEIPRPKVDFDFVKSVKKVIQTEEKKYVIHPFDLGTYPIFEKKEYLVPRLLLVKKDMYSYMVIGVLETDVMNNPKLFKTIKKSKNDFLELHDFELIKELK